MNTPGYLDLKNSANVAKWRWRWHLQGGSAGWSARPLQDLRNEEGQKQYREIELRRRHLRVRHQKKLINLMHERAERIRRKARKAL